MAIALRSGRRLKHGLVLTCCALMAAMWGAGAFLIQADHERTELEGLQRASGAAKAYDAFVDRHLSQIDLILTLLAEQQSLQELQRDLERLSKKANFQEAGIRSLYLTDALGAVIASSAKPAKGERGGTAADRGYFQVHQSNSMTGLYVGAPSVGRYSGQWRVHISRARLDANGAFTGVVVAAVDPSDFTTYYSEAQLGKQGIVALTGSDGVVRVSRKGKEFTFGDTVQGSALAQAVAARDEGVFATDSTFDGVPRLVAFKGNRFSGLFVTVALAQEEVLAPFYERRKAVLLAFAIASALLLAAFAPVLLTARQLDRSRREAALSSELFTAASDAQLDAFLIFEAVRDPQGELIDFVCKHANHRACRWLRRAGLDLLGRPLSVVLGAERASPWFTEFCQIVATRKAQVAELDLGTDHDGRIRVTRHMVPVGDGVAVNLRDITTTHRREAELAASNQAVVRSEKLLRGLSNAVPILLVHFDTQLRVTFANGTCERWFGQAWAQAEGKHIRELWGESLYTSRLDYLDRALHGEALEFVSERETVVGTKAFQNSYVPDLNEDGSVAGVYAVSADITELKKSEEMLGTLARTDSLTGLHNRRYFTEQLPLVLSRARRNERGVGLLFIDVDRFKAVNDTQGHAAGDAVLQEVSNRLRACVRKHDTVARFAGDEFVVLLEDLESEATAILVARKISSSMERRIAVDATTELDVTLSIGVAYDSGEDTTADALLARADSALYVVKSQGRNGYSISASGPTA
ncbi:diguanylate cyclase [Paucibacter sp. PLA-PC-4]|uniref:bifunctional diguanylate cyclase/phosphodiesterase n=1 Tax=Paucibacter sp. PLA-PC-4 TaxID=2993655 RepID=UPI00224B56B5|nr:diguanylate cyclase [Paucibacter sp. PLA-PC-4]MCX2865433.1 diguanylate cyclase [Paucibacter sp. PLA-PC-4]